ncbi:hypothetical protein SNEBB_010171 [Seison nebaliae]|nr:hypothetical protein SNEBB_010171 [Seison nebaliae]
MGIKKMKFAFCLFLFIIPNTLSSIRKIENERELQTEVQANKYLLLLNTWQDQDGTCFQHLSHSIIPTLNTYGIKFSELYLSIKSFTKIENEPQIIFFRNQQPIFFDGPCHHMGTFWLQDNLKTNVIELDDSNFEGRTQATTGSTTGDWMIIFKNRNSQELKTNRIILETLATEVKPKGKLIALMDYESSQETADRFQLKNSFTIILIRRNYYYKFEGELNYSNLKDFLFLSNFFESTTKFQIPTSNIIFNFFNKLFKSYVEFGGFFQYCLGTVIVSALSIFFLNNYFNRQIANFRIDKAQNDLLINSKKF